MTRPQSPTHAEAAPVDEGAPAMLARVYSAAESVVDQRVLEAAPAGSSDVEKGAEKPQSSGSGDGIVDSDDKFLVDWDGDDDPANPRNFSTVRKWGIIASLSFITLLTPLGSSMLAPGVPNILMEFNNFNNMVATFVVSIFVLGFAFGPLIMAPLSELYGRLWLYHATNVLFIVFTILCAESTSIGMLLAVRFLAGFAGVAVITCGAGTISDLMPPEKRGAALAVWSLGPLLGPVIGPVSGGFVVEDLGWRWVFWIVAILSGFSTILALIAQRETYAPVLLERKAARLRKSTGDARYRSKLQRSGTPREIFLMTIVRPGRLIALSPVVTLVCVHAALVFGVLYVLFTTFSFVYRDVYGFSTVNQGLSFLSMGIGNLIGLVYMGSQSDRLIQKQRAARGGDTYLPEDRLHWMLSLPAPFFIPFGLFVYGWTTYYAVHWIVPMIAMTFVGFGMLGVMMCGGTYLVDCYPEHAASVTAAQAVLRSLLGALLPLCGLDMYEALGLGWGNSLLAFLALALAPVLILLNKYGERIRTNPKFQHQF